MDLHHAKYKSTIYKWTMILHPTLQNSAKTENQWYSHLTLPFSSFEKDFLCFVILGVFKSWAVHLFPY